MPPPSSRRPDRNQAAASASRSRMYNLAGHAHSSGSLLPRSTDVHAASTSAATGAATPGRSVDAADAPYLTNIESHFGRVTLTAPDNLLRKQAKEKKQKIRQRKAQNAQAAAAALAAAPQLATPSSSGRNPAASSSNLLDSSRRYQTTLDDAPVSTGLLVPPSAQQMGMRRTYSGGQTPTLASSSHPNSTPPSTSQTVVARTRRRRLSSAAARDDVSRPASRASGISRPESALSFNDADSAQPVASSSNQTQTSRGERPPRSRTESAPAIQRRSHHAFDRTRDNNQADASPQAAAQAIPQTSMHRQNVWNDITEADPDDLPPPFPVGAPRPPTPPLPPTHSEAANDAQIIGPQPHARIPDSPPPPFVSDDEDEAVSAAEDVPPQRQSAASPAPEQPQNETNAPMLAGDDRPASRPSTPSSASASDDESIELTEERRAWEADIRSGLDFQVRLLREQQRRVARERAAAFRAALREEEQGSDQAQGTVAEEQAVDTAPPSAEQQPDVTAAAVEEDPAPTAHELVSTVEESQSETRTESRESRDSDPTADETFRAESDTARTGLDAEADVATAQSNAEQPRPLSTEETAPAEATTPAHTARPSTDGQPATQPAQIIQSVATSAAQASPRLASETQPTSALPAAREADTSGRLMLANEPRLGLPSMPASARPTSAGRGNEAPSARPSASLASRRISAHRKNHSDTQTPQSNQSTIRPDSNGRTSLSGLPVRRLVQGQAARGHDSDSHLPLSRRPEDTLYVISAPPPATYPRSSSDGEASAPHADAAASPAHAIRSNTVDDDAFSQRARPDDDDGAESDSSIEQWLAESAAFDALRKREEEAAARLQALREPSPVSDSDQEDDTAMPGAFNHQPSPHHRQSSATRKVPNPANLALMDRALPKAPPPLVLGRSRGGAAYSDSSSESTDTDDALDMYSSSDEDDEQHRAFYDARAAGGTANDPFINAHKSMHARNTSSAPNLSIADDRQDKLANEATAATSASRASGGLQRHEAVNRVGSRPFNAQGLPAEGPKRSLSLKAQGKLPERIVEPPITQQTDERAGNFEEDSSSSRDLSDEEEIVAPPKHVQPIATDRLGKSLASTQRSSLSLVPEPEPTTPAPAQVDVRRPSLDPLLQPLAYGQIGGRNELRDRLKGLFGQPLVAGSANELSTNLQASATKGSASAAQPTAAPVRRPSDDVRRVSDRSLQSVEPAIPVEAQSVSSAHSAGAPASALTAAAKQDDAASISSQAAPSVRRCPSGSSRIADRSASIDASTTSSSASRLPEQKARDEALLQIAQLSSSTQSRQDSLAALERLLARTGRPTSMLPPSAISRAELGGRLQLTSDVAPTESQRTTDAGLSPGEESSVAPTPPASNRLSRQGAIVRSRGPLPSPPSVLSRATSSASRPVSFVNPRSSAAPLPRGRLPAITDATRHFPPSASSTGPGVVPSWLSYIPSEERERLPAPLEPQRVSRPPGGKVSAMISRFEAAPTSNRAQPEIGGSSSPTKQSGALASTSGREDITRTESTQSIGSGAAESKGPSDGVERPSEPAVFRRFSRNDGDVPGEASVAQRRPPPPPPPTLSPRRTDTNPFRRSQASDRPTSNTSDMTQSTSMEALARQIDLAASEWTSSSLHDHSRSSQIIEQELASASQLAVPTPGPSTVTRSPRTQAMHTLTRREHESGAVIPPSLPSKSPLMTPEKILAAGSRNGLSASIAAAQAAALARRDGRESRTHSASSSVDAGTASVQSVRPLPQLPTSVRYGLGISEDRGELPRPPPLPARPRGRDWDAFGGSGVMHAQGVGSSARRQMAHEPIAESPPARSMPATPSNRQAQQSDGESPSRNGAASPASVEMSNADQEAADDTPITTRATPPRSASPNAEPSSSRSTPHRAPSLGLTDLDLLVSQLDQSSSNYEHLSLISEFLGPAKPVSATASQLASLSVGLIECDSRRVTKEGKIKQKLSCVGVRVDKCAICLAQYREGQRAVILVGCGHILHEECAVRLFRVDCRCPVCRAPAV